MGNPLVNNGKRLDGYTMTAMERFEASYMPIAESGCWFWVAATYHFGHGAFTVNGKEVRAHRWAYEHFVGSVPKGKWVLHKCDVPQCVNPAHLYLGTCKDNTRDMINRGRSKLSHWETRSTTKLTKELAVEIYNAPGKVMDIGKKYGISYQHVSDIKTGRRWSKYTGQIRE